MAVMNSDVQSDGLSRMMVSDTYAMVSICSMAVYMHGKLIIKGCAMDGTVIGS